jgi:hypothetical protein
MWREDVTCFTPLACRKASHSVVITCTLHLTERRGIYPTGDFGTIIITFLFKQLLWSSSLAAATISRALFYYAAIWYFFCEAKIVGKPIST